MLIIVASFNCLFLTSIYLYGSLKQQRVDECCESMGLRTKKHAVSMMNT